MEVNEHRRHAIVYGASGLIGWAVVDQLLKLYPKSGSFAKVTAITNRKITLSESFWPKEAEPNLQLVSGINLREGDGATLADSLKQAIENVDSVTHIYYLVFAAAEDDIEEVATNQRMFQNVINAHTLASPDLQFVVFPGGTRGYGIYASGGTLTPPLTEDMVNNLPDDYEKTVVYPVFRKLLDAASAGERWTWCEVCPDTIVGFTPNGSQFSLALHWAQYLSLFAYNHEIKPQAKSTPMSDVEIPFPGSAAGANALFTPVSAKTIARFMIYASLHPETCGGGQLFNIADQEEPCTYGDIWIQLAKWFGLVGLRPSPEEGASEGEALGVSDLPQDISLPTPGEYVSRHKEVFAKCGCEKAVSGGVGAGSRQLDSVGYWLTFDRQMSIRRLRNTGFEGDRDPVQGWLESFEMFRKAGLII